VAKGLSRKKRVKDVELVTAYIAVWWMKQLLPILIELPDLLISCLVVVGVVYNSLTHSLSSHASVA